MSRSETQIDIGRQKKLQLQAGIVRILNLKGDTAGTGFIVSDKLVVTCAHVIGIGKEKTRPDTVNLVLLIDKNQKKFRASVEYWYDQTKEDLAVLRLQENLPEEAIPLKLGTSINIEGHQFETYGFPRSKKKNGMWGKGEIVGRLKHEISNCDLIQLTSNEITGGFSGAPVLDQQTNRVVGVLIERTSPEGVVVQIDDEEGKTVQNIVPTGRGDKTAFMTPTFVLCKVCPELKIEDICPYVGLSAFTEAEKDFFYGRDDLISELKESLEKRNRYFLAVVGSSGSGKSSLVQAGLLPKLIQASDSLFYNSKIISFRPQDDPEASFVKVLPPEIKIANSNFWKGFEDFLALQKRNHIIIFIDQFEELFARCPSKSEDFTEKLLNLITKYDRITLIIAIRADFYEPLLNSCFGSWLIGTKKTGDRQELSGQVNVKPMNEDELRSVIEKPANQVGLKLDPGLIELIIRDIKPIKNFRDRQKKDILPQSILPLLEFTLEELWKEEHENNFLTCEGYEKKGGVIGSLENKAEETYHGWSKEEEKLYKELTRQVFTRLINIGSSNIPDTRNPPLSIEELGAIDKENQDIHKVVTKFVDARLLVTTNTSFDSNEEEKKKSGKKTVEIIHESLISSWERLKTWVEEKRPELLLGQTIRQQASEWEENKRQEEYLILRGNRLESAEKLLSEDQDNYVKLSKLQADYVKACIDRRELERKNDQDRKDLKKENLEERISKFAEAARLDSIENKKLDALTKLIEAGNLLQKSLNTEIRADVKWHFLITFGQIFDEITETNSFQAHPDWIYAVSFSPDGQTIASSSRDKTIKLWSLDGNLLQTLEGHENDVMDVSFSPDGEMLASTSKDNTIKLWKKSTDPNVQTPWIFNKTLEGHENRVLGVSFSPDSQIIASASQDTTVRLWDKNGVLLKILRGHEGGVSNVAFSRDSKLIASASKDHTIKLWELKNYELKSTSEKYFAEVSAVSFGLDNKTLISSNGDKSISFWDIDKNIPIVIKSKGHEAEVWYATFSPDGQTIAASGKDGVITIWDKNGDCKRTFKGHRGSVTKVSFSPNSKTLVSGSLDKTIKLWDCTRKFDGHSSKISKIDFSLDGETIATASEDGSVKLWHRNGELRRSLKGHGREVCDIKFNPKRKTIAIASQHEVKILSFKGEEKQSFSEYNSLVKSISFNPDGTEIAVGYDDGTVIRLLNIKNKNDDDDDDDKNEILGQPFLEKHSRKVNMLTFSPQGTMIATANADKTVKLLDLNGNLLAHREYQSAAYYVSFSPDGGIIAIASINENNAHQIELWNPNNNYQQILKGNSNSLVMSIGFIPDSDIVASISKDQSITLWNTADASWLKTIEGNDNSSSISAALIFCSQNDKSAIAVANSEQRISLWSLSLDELLRNSNNQISDYKNRLNYST